MTRSVLVGGSVRPAAIVDRLSVSPMIQVSDVVAPTGVSAPTARVDLRRLTGCGLLKELAGERPVTYFSPPVFRACYPAA